MIIFIYCQPGRHCGLQQWCGGPCIQLFFISVSALFPGRRNISLAMFFLSSFRGLILAYLMYTWNQWCNPSKTNKLFTWFRRFRWLINNLFTVTLMQNYIHSFMFQFIQQIDTKCFYLPDIVLPTEGEMVKITENSLLHNIYDCRIRKISESPFLLLMLLSTFGVYIFTNTCWMISAIKDLGWEIFSVTKCSSSYFYLKLMSVFMQKQMYRKKWQWEKLL